MKPKTKNIILWIISVFLILSGIVFIGETPIQSILLVLLGIILLPPVDSKINEKIIKDSKKRKIIKRTIETIVFIAVVFSMPSNQTIETVANNNLNEIKTGNFIINEIENDTNETTNNEELENSNETKEDQPQKTTDKQQETSIQTTPQTTTQTTTQTTSTQKSTTSSESDYSGTVYVTPTGKRYHYSATCGGKNSTASTLNRARERGLTPCQKCAK